MTEQIELQPFGVMIFCMAHLSTNSQITYIKSHAHVYIFPVILFDVQLTKIIWKNKLLVGKKETQCESPGLDLKISLVKDEDSD